MSQENHAEQTVFEKIIAGTIPATIVYEDDRCIAFLDISPVAIGHTLIVPKMRYEWIQDIPDNLLGHLFANAALLMRAQKAAFSCDYVQLEVIGKDVPHAHIHLIPRMLTDDLLARHHAAYENGDAMSAAAHRIISML